MKKVLLSSVAALAVFATATPVFANNQGYVHTGSLDNKEVVKAEDFFMDDASKDFNSGLKQPAKDGLNNADADSTKAKFKAAGEELKPVPGKPGEFVVSGKAKDAAKPAGKDAAKPGAAKSSAAAGQKALPKTSAVK